jgi:hypothetical protein
MSESYGDVVIKTFRENAIHTALLVDDKFPTYQQLCDSHTGKEQGSFQINESAELHSTFFKRNIPCDVENNVDRIEQTDFKRLRKSDLIVLDYHLREDDSSASIRIIKELSESKHFNIVILYTSETPTTAWLEIAAHLRGGWEDKSVTFDDDANEYWDLFEYEVKAADVADYISGDYKKVVSTMMADNKQAFDEEKIPNQYRYRFIEAKIHQYIEELFGNLLLKEELAAIKSNYSETNCWVQSKNLFLVIKQKNDSTTNEADPRGIIEALDQALIDWNPNPFQIMISNIQNILEREGLATDSEYFGNKHFQMGLAYSMASQFTEQAEVDDILPTTLKKVQEDLLEFLQQRIGKKIHSQGLVQKAFKSKIPHIEKKPDIEKIAKTILGEALPDVDLDTILFDRNAFVSTQEFYETHVTNGTIFRQKDEDGNYDYWACSYASCDLVPRKTKKKNWREQLFPFRPFTAIKLQPNGGVAANVTNAEQARTIFLHCDDEKMCFVALSDTDTPHLEQMYGAKALVVKSQGGKTIFNAQRLVQAKDDQDKECLQLESCSFEVVGQLRRAYASRLLAKVANYKARIGLDYISPQ